MLPLSWLIWPCQLLDFVRPILMVRIQSYCGSPILSSLSVLFLTTLIFKTLLLFLTFAGREHLIREVLHLNYNWIPITNMPPKLTRKFTFIPTSIGGRGGKIVAADRGQGNKLEIRRLANLPRSSWRLPPNQNPPAPWLNKAERNPRNPTNDRKRCRTWRLRKRLTRVNFPSPPKTSFMWKMTFVLLHRRVLWPLWGRRYMSSSCCQTWCRVCRQETQAIRSPWVLVIRSSFRKSYPGLPATPSDAIEAWHGRGRYLGYDCCASPSSRLDDCCTP